MNIFRYLRNFEGLSGKTEMVNRKAKIDFISKHKSKETAVFLVSFENQILSASDHF